MRAASISTPTRDSTAPIGLAKPYFPLASPAKSKPTGEFLVRRLVTSREPESPALMNAPFCEYTMIWSTKSAVPAEYANVDSDVHSDNDSFCERACPPVLLNRHVQNRLNRRRTGVPYPFDGVWVERWDVSLTAMAASTVLVPP